MKDFAIKFLVIGAITMVVGWFLLDYHYRGVTKELNEISRQQVLKEQKLDSCTATAWQDYDSTRETQCGLYGLGVGCSLDMEIELALRKTLENDKNRCVELYK